MLKLFNDLTLSLPLMSPVCKLSALYVEIIFLKSFQLSFETKITKTHNQSNFPFKHVLLNISMLL